MWTCIFLLWQSVIRQDRDEIHAIKNQQKKKNTVTDYFWYWSETILIDNPFSIITGLYQVTKVEIYNSSHRGMRLMVSQNFWTDRKRKGSSVL